MATYVYTNSVVDGNRIVVKVGENGIAVAHSYDNKGEPHDVCSRINISQIDLYEAETILTEEGYDRM